MRIKTDSISKNEYIFAGDTWVRNFTKLGVKPQGLTSLFPSEEYSLILSNEVKNLTFNHLNIGNESFYFPKIVVVSDGYNFEAKHEVLRELPEDVAIIAVNGALTNWKLLKTSPPRPINFYLINNPYPDCLSNLPRKSKYYPSCLASLRTYPGFLEQYHGQIYRYTPTADKDFGVSRPESYFVDDYRNPICAALTLAFRFGVEKLALFCCDDSFSECRPAAERLPNGLWTYPQHLRSHQIIDANLYWLTHQTGREVRAVNCSLGPEYHNAAYISEEDLLHFFEEEPEED